MLEEWIGKCEICGYEAHVLGKTRKSARRLARAVHKKAKGKLCKGLIVTALRSSECKKKAVA